MSITAIRKATEKKGCQAVLVVIGVALALGMVLSYNRGGLNSGRPGEIIAMTIEGTPITPELIDQRAEAYARNSNLDRSNPRNDFQALAGALTQIIGQTVIQKLAAANSVKVTDDDILKTAEGQIQQQVDQYKLQVASIAKLKPDAKPEEVEQAFTKMMGKSSQALIADQLTQVKEQLKTPANRGPLEGAALAEKLQKSFAEKAVYSEEDLKKSYDTYFFEEVAFDSAKTPRDVTLAKAQEARDELVKGTDPKTVRTKFAPESKRTTLELTRQAMELNPQYKSLMDMKAGEVSEVVEIAPFPSVLKLTKIENKLPKDFEKTKASMLTLNKSQKGSTDFQKAFTDGRNALKIDWKDQGLKMVWNTVVALTDPETIMSPDQTLAKLKDLETESKSIKLTPETNQRTLALAQYMISEEILNSTNGADKKSALDEWLDQVGTVLGYYESIPLRLDVTNKLLEAKENEKAFEMLIEAARANRNFEQDGQGWYSQISALSDQGKKTKAFTEEQTKQIDKELQDWLTEKVAFDKEQADAAEESRKASEELDKEVKAAEQEKAAAEAKKKTEGNKPASTGGQPTTTGN